MIRILAFFALTCFFYSCRCGDVDCPGLELQYTEWVPHHSNEIISFVNDSGVQIDFAVTQHNISEPQSFDCGPDGLMGCICPECPEPRSNYNSSTTDTSRKVINLLGQTVMTYKNMGTYVNKIVAPGSPEEVVVSYSIFDHSNQFTISPQLILNSGDTLFASFTAGSVTYTDVVFHERDTTIPVATNPIYNVYFVWKSWYNKQYGVIAFYDLKTQSLFYRKP